MFQSHLKCDTKIQFPHLGRVSGLGSLLWLGPECCWNDLERTGVKTCRKDRFVPLGSQQTLSPASLCWYIRRLKVMSLCASCFLIDPKLPPPTFVSSPLFTVGWGAAPHRFLTPISWLQILMWRIRPNVIIIHLWLWEVSSNQRCRLPCQKAAWGGVIRKRCFKETHWKHPGHFLSITTITSKSFVIIGD